MRAYMVSFIRVLYVLYYLLGVLIVPAAEELEPALSTVLVGRVTLTPRNTIFQHLHFTKVYYKISILNTIVLFGNVVSICLAETGLSRFEWSVLRFMLDFRGFRYG